jgi:RsiW-degrading membrane proteinase PrsW (M82 family)
MKMQPGNIERRLRIAGIMIIAGLLVELFSLRWSHPTAFLVFIILGGALIGIGILFYLYSLISRESVEAQSSDVFKIE